MALGVGCTFYVTPPEMCPVWPFQARSLRLNRRLSCSRSLVTCWPRESRAAPSPGSALPSRTEPVCLLGVTVPGQHEGLPARKTLPRVTIQRQGAGLGPLPIDPPPHPEEARTQGSEPLLLLPCLSSFPGPSRGNSRRSVSSSCLEEFPRPCPGPKSHGVSRAFFPTSQNSP